MYASVLFVANNLPPLSMDNFDMSGVIRDMEVIKLQMKVMQEAQDNSAKFVTVNSHLLPMLQLVVIDHVTSIYAYHQNIILVHHQRLWPILPKVIRPQ